LAQVPSISLEDQHRFLEANAELASITDVPVTTATALSDVFGPYAGMVTSVMALLIIFITPSLFFVPSVVTSNEKIVV